MQVQNVRVTRRSDSIKVVLVIQFCLFRQCHTNMQQVVWVSLSVSHCQRTHKPPRDIYYCRKGRKTTPNISIVANLLTNLKAIFHFPTHISKLVSIFPDHSRLISIHANPLTRLQVWLRAHKSQHKRKDPVRRLHIWSHTGAAIYVTLNILATAKVPYLSDHLSNRNH